jgi:3-dehydroquinate synthase
MQILQIRGSNRNSRIIVGAKLEQLTEYTADQRLVIITDQTVNRLYGKRFPSAHVIVIENGELNKTFATVQAVYAELVKCEADRETLIVGIGGGIVCDITGFVASTYLRGVRFGFVASTLLAQADASVGGKNGINFQGYKNMVGTFNQPDFVLCDTSLLQTLPPVERQSGFAEIVKHAAIADAAMFRRLEENTAAANALDPGLIEYVVYRSLRIKSEIVNQDEREAGMRRTLNFGHTFGHALEKVTGLPHGHAVSVGMVLAARLSMRRGLLSDQDERRLRQLLVSLELPVRVDFERQAAMEALGKDKKRAGEAIFFVLLNAIGNAVISAIPLNELQAAMEAISGV